MVVQLILVCLYQNSSIDCSLAILFIPALIYLAFMMLVHLTALVWQVVTARLAPMIERDLQRSALIYDSTRLTFFTLVLTSLLYIEGAYHDRAGKTTFIVLMSVAIFLAVLRLMADLLTKELAMILYVFVHSATESVSTD